MSAERPGLMQRIATLESPPPWSLGFAILAIVLAFIAIVAGVAVAEAWVGGASAALLIGWTLAALAVSAFIFQSRRAPADRAALRLGAPRMALPLLIVLNMGLAMLLDLLSLAITGRFVPLPELLPLALAPGDVFAWVIAAVFMLAAQPLAEELVFRGVAQPALRTALGAWPGLLVAALAYGAFHMMAYTPVYADADQNTLLWFGLILPALDGVIFGMNRAATGSTRAAIIAHASFGLFALIKVAFIV